MKHQGHAEFCLRGVHNSYIKTNYRVITVHVRENIERTLIRRLIREIFLTATYPQIYDRVTKKDVIVVCVLPSF